ncbi:Heparanase-like protein 1 [Acorus calamus]|uniref:Heparanase-like protein 1 n=1 Tax=Acorus calamus TaxID=4465 RepID=A0AAV9DWW5_ACOCL|nr:Heparanase-like protein 1 [Acorus calamus]
MSFKFAVLLFFCSLSGILAQDPLDATIIIRGVSTMAETDENFVCATIDWWPPQKCNYNHCPWGESSVLTLDVHHPFLAKAIQAFNPLRIRIGGSLQDQVVYGVGSSYPCLPFAQMAAGLFGFSKGCLSMDRWDELNLLFQSTGAIVTFGLNALRGRHKIGKGIWGGPWNATNARNFIEYTILKGYQVDSWEFGNELSGDGIGAKVGSEQYGKDLIHLKTLLDDLYKDSRSCPLLLAPGGFYDQQWYAKLLQFSGPNVVSALTHHIYNLGPGSDPHLTRKIVDPHYLSRVADTFREIQLTIQRHGPWASAWVGESGGAYNSGGHLCSTVASTYGKGVLSIDLSESPYLRAYAHCSKQKPGVSLLLINLSNSTTFSITVHNDLNINKHTRRTISKDDSFIHGLKKSVIWVGTKSSDGMVKREEYHLTPKDGNLHSRTMLLNGSPLELTEDGDIPPMDPLLVPVDSPISVAALSIAFVVLPDFEAHACL